MDEGAVLGLGDLRRKDSPVGGAAPEGFVADELNLIVAGLAFHVDDECLKPGHILLSESAEKTAAAFIRVYQQFTEPDRVHSRWTHVAIVGNNRMVWDIVPERHVRCVRLSEFTEGKKAIAIRALRDIVLDGEALEGNIVRQAAARYPPFSAATFKAYRQNLLSFDKTMPAFSENEFNCSLFVDRLIRASAKVEPCPQSRTPIVLPANFASSDVFVDLPLPKMIYRGSA